MSFLQLQTLLIHFFHLDHFLLLEVIFTLICVIPPFLPLPSYCKSFSQFMRCSFRLIGSRILSYSSPLITRWSYYSWLHSHMRTHWQGQCLILAQIDIFYIPLDTSVWVSHIYQMSYVKDELSTFFIKYSWLSIFIGWILGFKVL